MKIKGFFKGNKPIVFLIYINRSGSTYLANLLNQYENIGVSLEAYFPDGILRRPVIINRNEDIDKFLKILYSDIKFRSWEVDESELKNILLYEDKPIKFKKFLQIILGIYFREQDSRNIKVYIYKCAGYIKYLDILKKIFPDSKVICILRDPRAIYNSQKKSLSSIEKKPMSKNPIRAGLQWNKVIKVIDKHKDENWFYLIRYEDLIESKDEALNDIVDFLCVSKEKIKSYNYLQKIPREQRHLHKNIDKNPINKRIRAWEKELNYIEIGVIEKVIGKKLEKYGYNFFTDENYRKYNIQYMKYKIKHITQRIFDKFLYLKSWSGFLDKMWVRLKKRKYFY